MGGANVPPSSPGDLWSLWTPRGLEAVGPRPGCEDLGPCPPPTLSEACGEDARDWELLRRSQATSHTCHLFPAPASASSCQVEEVRSTLRWRGGGLGLQEGGEETPLGLILHGCGDSFVGEDAQV